MSSAAWDGTTSKEGVVVGVQYGILGIRPSGTAAIYRGPVAEIKDEAGNFVTGIALDSSGRTDAAAVQPITTATVFKKFSDLTTMTATTWVGTASAGDKGQIALGDIVQATSSALVVIKRNK